jgi:hypothetical protein
MITKTAFVQSMIKSGVNNNIISYVPSLYHQRLLAIAFCAEFDYFAAGNTKKKPLLIVNNNSVIQAAVTLRI